ncbi:lambda exonuclease family protein [Xanthobacter sp. DSM 24535]|uniref:lambda exonuclease family protein n=1 Tax=Roseixanthobacter psychrophilus TaxID=3119917 RepID=UPI003729ED86
MTMQIIDCVQGTDEWFRARAGIPTASEFSTVMASGRGGGESKTRRTYMFKLAGEILTGEPMERFTNGAMERGHVMEDEARSAYAFIKDVEPVQVGFIVNGQKGYSPDSLVGSDGLLEIKTAAPHLLIDKLLSGEFSPEHKAQCQGGLWVAEREWIDLVTYWPKLPPLIVRAVRDEVYIAGLARAVAQFNEELAEVVEQIRRYGDGKAAA